MDIIKVKRYINYYELDFSFINETNISSFFTKVTRLAVTRAKIRYQRFGDKYIFIQGITNDKGVITAKVRCVRLDLFPELINMNTDIVTEIDGDDYDGIVETTHIIIDYRKPKTIIAVEYNHPGAKIIDIVEYLTRIGVNQSAVEKIGYLPIVNSDLTRLKTRINRISELTMKIHKDNLPKLKEMDGNIFQSAQAATEHFENEYAVMDFKVDYRRFSETPIIKNSIFNLINFLNENPSDRHIFNYLRVKAEDEEKNNLLETFDLLLDKIYTPVKVERKRKQKTIISEDMFGKMMAELDKLRLR